MLNRQKDIDLEMACLSLRGIDEERMLDLTVKRRAETFPDRVAELGCDCS